MNRTLRLAMAAFLLAVPLPAFAQVGSPHPSLAEALVELARRCEVSLIYDPGLVVGRRARVQLRGEDPEELLKELLAETGLIPVRLSSGTFAILRDESVHTPVGFGTISGRVLEAPGGIPVTDVHVSLGGSEQFVAVSGPDGDFRFIQVPAGIYRLRTSHVSYVPRLDSVVVYRAAETRLLLHLQSEPVYMDVVEIEDTAAVAGSLVMTIHPDRGERMALGTGTRDAILSLEGFPGVQAERGTSNLHVQGGDAGDHQLVLDGMPVFEPVHLHGLIGAFSPYALRSISVHRAGFGASLGSRISGVITAEHVLESPDGHRVNAYVDPLSFNARLMMGGPLWRGSVGHTMVALRTDHGFAQDYIARQLRQWNEADPFLQYATLLSLIEDDPSAGAAYAGLLRPGLDSARTSAQVGFTDLHVAGRLQFHRGGVLYGSVYRSTNMMAGSRLFVPADEPDQGPQSADHYEWRNVNGQLTYSLPLGSRAVVRAQLRRSRYLLEHRYVAPDNRNTFWLLTPDLELREIRLETRPTDDGNYITELAGEGAAYFSMGRGATLQAGVEGVRTDHRFRIDDLFFRPIHSERVSRRFATYAEQEIAGSRKTFRGGVRLTTAEGHRAVFVEPRVAIELRPEFGGQDRLVLRTAGGIYRQFLNQYDLSSVSPSALAPSIRFWLPVDSTILPPKAYHAAASVEVRSSARWTVGVELFYRYQPHLLNVDYGSLWQRLRGERPEATVQSEFLESGRGRALGAAATLAYRSARLEGWFRGDVSRSRRTFAFLGDEPEVAPWSEPVAMHAFVAWEPASPVRVTARWKSTWGRSWAFRQAYYHYLAADPLVDHQFGDLDLRTPAAHDLPDFFQLDLGAYYFRNASGVDLRVGLNVLNVLDRANVVDYALDFSYSEEQGLRYQPKARVLSPRMLAGSISLAW